MGILPIRKIDLLVLAEFVPFFIMGVAAFTLLMVAVTLMKDMLTYVTEYGLSMAEVGQFFLLALPQTVAYTFPMAILFSALISFGRMSDTGQITALRAGGIGFFRIVLPALFFAWFVVLLTFVLNEKIAPQSTLEARLYIQRALLERGITLQANNISYMDQNAGWLFAAASGEGNTFRDVKWWDFSREGIMILTTAEEGEWLVDRWEFHNARIATIVLEDGQEIGDVIATGEELIEESFENKGNSTVIRLVNSKSIEMKINRTPTDILAREGHRDPEEMSLQELNEFIRSDEALHFAVNYRRKLLGTYHAKIAIPFAAIVFTLIAAPLGLSPQRSSSTRGVGMSLLLVFAYYLLTTFSIKIAEGGVLVPVLAAWLPNILFLAAGAILNGRFYIRST